MAKLAIKAGTTSKLADVFIQDSSSTVGAGLTGLTNATSGLTWYYYREGAGAAVQVTTIDTMTLGTWVTRGFIVIDGTNMPGCYQIGIPDAAIAAGAKSVIMLLKGATNMAPLALEIELTGWDNQDATNGGLSKLTSLTFTGANKVDASVRDWIGGTIPAVNVTGVPLVDLKYTLGTISPATAGSVRADAVTGAVGSVTGNVGGSVASVTGAVGSVTGNVGGNVVGSVASVTARVTANSDQINGNATAATNVAHTMQAITRGTVGAAASTTSITTSAISSPSSAGASGQFIGRTILFDADTATANLQGQASNITANTTGATPTFTVTALTTAPAVADTFSIV